MVNRKPIFIIPGFKHQTTNKAYKEITRILKSEGYSPILINIRWRNTTISENTEYFLKKYRKINSKKKYVLGFSLGAMIAFIASTKISMSGLILCSLSPYFKEDLLKLNNSWTSPIMIQKYNDFSGLHCGTLAKRIRAKKILMLYGAREEKSLIKRVKDAFDQISSTNKYLIPILKTEHNIGDKRYLNTIHKIAKQLN
ncbi:MAG: hypothetical protein Q7K55_00310 [Candidatus Levybacteria bacterium]|nr:hypothetical protein [Candidatus Levybacteria bacterium]